MKKLVTERLVLDELKTTDATTLFLLRSDENVNRYIGRTPPASMEQVTEFVDRIRKGVAEGGSFYWAIRPAGEPSLIGTICLWNFSDERTEAEIGYEMLPSSQGRGYASEAVKKIIEFAFEELGLKKIVAQTHEENTASSRVLEKQGFHRTEKIDTLSPANILYSLENQASR